jgi:glutathione S-transferase
MIMKLYYAPGACSLASHIALHEAGFSFEHESVDLRTKMTAAAADFTAINPKGCVPGVILDKGEMVTEEYRGARLDRHRARAAYRKGMKNHWDYLPQDYRASLIHGTRFG